MSAVFVQSVQHRQHVPPFFLKVLEESLELLGWKNGTGGCGRIRCAKETWSPERSGEGGATKYHMVGGLSVGARDFSSAVSGFCQVLAL